MYIERTWAVRHTWETVLEEKRKGASEGFPSTQVFPLETDPPLHILYCDTRATSHAEAYCYNGKY